MRLPGTGEGVARLVEVSMVKVDMAAPLAALLRRGKDSATPALAYFSLPSRSSHWAPWASEIASSTAVLWSRRTVKARRMAQVASS